MSSFVTTKKIVGLLFLLLLALPVIVFAQAPAQRGFFVTNNFTGTAGGNDLPGAIIAVVNTLLLIAGIVVVIFMVIGGVQYVTSAGDEDKAETAKNTIMYAVIGAIVILLSAVIVRFVISAIGF